MFSTARAFVSLFNIADFFYKNDFDVPWVTIAGHACASEL
jgi:hypothetical protein